MLIKDHLYFNIALPKIYGIVRTKYGSHVRNYHRKIKNGLNSLEANWIASYENIPSMTELFYGNHS